MGSEFSTNIKGFRKKRGMTQEQLAEAMGVTVGAVYKWEQNLSTPDIQTIMDLAHFFGVSVDALVGYKIQDGSAETYAKQIEILQQEKKYGEAVREAEQALVRYPNNFSIVYNCGRMYEMKCLENTEPNFNEDVEKAIEFFRKAELLLSQNTNPEINAFSIEAEIAHCKIAQGKTEDALEILKKTNVNGVHNAIIGQIYAVNDAYPLEKAALFLTDALVDSFSMQIDIMLGYLNYYGRKGEVEAELDIIQWLLGYLRSMRPDQSVSYVDKFIAPFCSEKAHVLDMLNRPEEAQEALEEAFRVAVRYDAAPTSRTDSIRFCLSDGKIVHDDVGSSTILAIEEQMKRENFSAKLYEIWERLKRNV